MSEKIQKLHFMHACKDGFKKWKKQKDTYHAEGEIEETDFLLLEVEEIRKFFGFSKSQLETQIHRKRKKDLEVIYINGTRYIYISHSTFHHLLKMYERRLLKKC